MGTWHGVLRGSFGEDAYRDPCHDPGFASGANGAAPRMSAAFGSAAQEAVASGSGHVPAAVQGPSFCQGNTRATPWLTSDTVPSGRVPEVGALGRRQPSEGALPGVPSQLKDSLNQLLHAYIAPSSRAHVFTMSLGLPT